jgi:hypothetical protein
VLPISTQLFTFIFEKRALLNLSVVTAGSERAQVSEKGNTDKNRRGTKNANKINAS